MHHTTIALLICIFTFTCNLSAQEASPEALSAAVPESVGPIAELEDVLVAAVDGDQAAADETVADETVADETVPSEAVADQAAADETVPSEAVAEETVSTESAASDDSAEATEIEAEVVELEEDELNTSSGDEDEAVEGQFEDTSDADETEGETVELNSEGETEETDEDEEAEDEEGDDEDEDEEDGPVFVRLSEDGALIGAATAIVGGDVVPIEANVSLVRDGVLLSKIVSEEDGSFAFQDISPGDYDMFGTASSYCGQQALTVLSSDNCTQCNDGVSINESVILNENVDILPGNNCTVCGDSVGLELSQGGSCFRGFGGAPASSFSSAGVGGGGGLFGGGGGAFGGGGGVAAAAGGGGAAASTGLRLLGIGGIATAIAVGSSDDDEIIPSEASPFQ